MRFFERTIELQCNQCGLIATIPKREWEDPKRFVCKHCDPLHNLSKANRTLRKVKKKMTGRAD